MKVFYEKPSLSIQQQIELLRSRGIKIADIPVAERFLKYHNYYYISGYLYYFEKKAPARTHELLCPVSIEQIIELVNFDQELREHFFSAVQTIEMGIRSSVARHLSLPHGPFCIEKPSLFKDHASHAAMLDIIRKAIGDHGNEAFIAHFKTHYVEEIPPAWVIIEVITFGTISRLYSNLLPEYQKSIAKDFDVDHFVFTSWLRAVTELRNACAHHARLWNKVFVNFPKVRKADVVFPLLPDRVSRLGSFIPLVGHLLRVMGAGNAWQKGCLDLLKENPSIKPADFGFGELVGVEVRTLLWRMDGMTRVSSMNMTRHGIPSGTAPGRVVFLRRKFDYDENRPIWGWPSSGDKSA